MKNLKTTRAIVEKKMSEKFGINIAITKHFIERLRERIKADELTEVISAVSDAVERVKYFNDNGFEGTSISAKGLSSGKGSDRITVPVTQTRNNKLLLLTVY